MINAKTITYYRSVGDLIYENTTKEEEENLPALFETGEDYKTFLHIDDFENYGYFLLDYKRIIITLDDEVISSFDSFEDFIKASAKEMKEWREND